MGILFLQNLIVALITASSICTGTLNSSILIVVSFDGFRHDYIDKVPTPNLHRLIDDGVLAKWMKSAFITKTFPNHFSIATGFYEEFHDIVANEMYDPILNASFDMSNTETKWWDNGRTVPIWVANQLSSSNHYSGGMMWPGTNVRIHNQSAFYHQTYNKSVPWKKRVNNALSWITNEIYPANLVLLYFEEPDGAGHTYGPDSEEVKQKITEADDLVGYIIGRLEELNIFERTNLIILSDHGMSGVPKSHLIDIDTIVNSSLYKKFGSSPVWNILPLEGQEHQVYKNLLEGSKTHNYNVYRKHDIPEEYYYKESCRIMDILVVADIGWGLISSNESSDGLIRGEHGYNNSLPEMWPIFIARGPAFLHNYTSKSFYNVDVYPLMCHLLHIKCIQTNGSLIRISDMLNVEVPLITQPSLPTSYIVGITSLLVLCVIGGIAVIIFTSLTKQKPAGSEFDMKTMLPHTGRTDRQNASLEEEQKLLNDSIFSE